ncbi:hypothetical protein PSAB6_70042 [Paraburkholderia sabiae]|nr:hypothetical protein PSAB6_70042 [Paraburkholderia sabiae]
MCRELVGGLQGRRRAAERLRAAVTRRQHRAHAAARIARAGDVLAGFRRVEVVLAVVSDHAAVHFVHDRVRALQTAHGRARRQRGEILLAVVVDAFSITVDIFVDAVTFLTEVREVLARRRARCILIALRILRHFDAIRTDQDRAFGRDHVAREDIDLLEVVVSHVVRFDIERFVLVGTLRVRKRRKAGKRQGDQKCRKSGAACTKRTHAAGLKTGERFVHAVTLEWIYPGCYWEPPESAGAMAPRTLPKSCITRVTLL